MKFTNLFGVSLLISFTCLGQIPCENGMAGNYPCRNVDLLAHIPLEGLETGMANDIWGWTDPSSGYEYVIVGTYDGASFVDISDPINPVYLGMLPDHSLAQSASSKLFHDEKSAWRDVKVFQNHAYIVGEEENQGVQIFDLTQLRDVVNPPVIFTESGHYDGVGNSHNMVINENSGFGYAVGSTRNSDSGVGGLHIIDLSDPINPAFVSSYHESGYVHDAQCVIYNGPDQDYDQKEICFCSNATNFAIVDVDNKNDITLISRNFYETSAYTHQGWLTTDHRFFLMNDEGDERDPQDPSNTRTYVWNVEDLDHPYIAGIYLHGTASIDHNLYTKGNTVYQSNYTAGLRVLDSEQVQYGLLREKGYFDTHPQNNFNEFNGSWSNYPYFESGVIAVTDIAGGLFLVRENYQESYIIHQPEYTEACLGDMASLVVEVGGGSPVYQWQMYDGSEFSDLSTEDVYEGMNTYSLVLSNATLDQNGLLFRCKVTSKNGEEVFTEPAGFSVRDCTLDIPESKNMSLFPNPTSDLIQLTNGTTGTYHIISISGRIVSSGELTTQTPQIDLATIPKGLYLFQLKTPNGTFINSKFRKI